LDAEKGRPRLDTRVSASTRPSISERLQCRRSQDRSVEAQALLQPVFEQFTDGTVMADLKLPSVY
jgi:hypothetical protein